MKIDKLTVKQAVLKAFEDLKIGDEFSGIEFKKMCVNYDPALKDKYVETFLRLLRYTHRDEFVCINRSKSKFRKVSVC